MRTEQAVRRTFSRWRDLKTRANRAEFWQFTMFFVVTSLSLGWLANEAVFWVGYGSIRADAVVAALLLSLLLLYVPFLALLARRYNDIGIPRIGVNGSVSTLFALMVIFIAFREQTIEAGFPYVVPITHAAALALAALPSSTTSSPSEVTQ